MDPKQQQEDELMVLESVYMTEFEAINRDFPNIEVKLTFPTVPEAARFNVEPQYLFDVSLLVKLPATYPDTVPELSLDGVTEHLNETENDKLLQELRTIAEQNVGMPMIYTVVSELTEKLEKLVMRLAKEKSDAEFAKRQQEEEQAFKEYEADRVTVESFNAWRKMFDEEMRPIREVARQAYTRKVPGRLTGKQMFLQDQLLSLSDLKLVDPDEKEEVSDSVDKLLVDGVEVDESLFQDDIELPDSDED